MVRCGHASIVQIRSDGRPGSRSARRATQRLLLLCAGLSGPCSTVLSVTSDHGGSTKRTTSAGHNGLTGTRICTPCAWIRSSMSTSAAAAEVAITGSDQVIVIGVAVVALVALVIAFVLRAGVLAAGTGTPKMQEISAAVQEGAAAYLGRQFRTLGVFVVIVFVLLFALPATTTGERIGRSDRLPVRRRVLGLDRLLRHVAGHPGQRPGRRRRQRRRWPGEGHADRLPHRRRGRPGHHRPRPARRLRRRPGLRRRGPEGVGGLRLRCRHAGHVHAGRRRHLHQGRRRGRRPGRQGRAGHPRGRRAQRRHHRRQRR